MSLSLSFAQNLELSTYCKWSDFDKKEKGKITNKEYQEINLCSRNTASNDLTQLVELKIFEASGLKGAGAYYQLK